jgi:regulatory protein YycI of two-component signal transduction system YycFG
MIQFLLSISLVIFFILEITLLKRLFAHQSNKMLKEIVESWDPNLDRNELNTHEESNSCS